VRQTPLVGVRQRASCGPRNAASTMRLKAGLLGTLRAAKIAATVEMRVLGTRSSSRNPIARPAVQPRTGDPVDSRRGLQSRLLTKNWLRRRQERASRRLS
jgi:hypothetical protein